ncbi:hypothetical protein K0M31_012685 [Melipona bicolor]|uniref:Uncharacterized protein n=1 Tax=Melipona bicolor TaxID=60889 RepID=A0AA40KH69_9HYME|nr:hypothetical protein K0M31_012685 [Melipona bicolor]
MKFGNTTLSFVRNVRDFRFVDRDRLTAIDSSLRGPISRMFGLQVRANIVKNRVDNNPRGLVLPREELSRTCLPVSLDNDNSRHSRSLDDPSERLRIYKKQLSERAGHTRGARSNSTSRWPIFDSTLPS